LAQAIFVVSRCASLCSSVTMAVRAIAISTLLLGVNAIELTEANWDTETAGKSVFIKFLAPW